MAWVLVTQIALTLVGIFYGLHVPFVGSGPATWCAAAYSALFAAAWLWVLWGQRAKLAAEASSRAAALATHGMGGLILSFLAFNAAATTGCALYTRLAGLPGARVLTVEKSQWNARRRKFGPNDCYQTTFTEGAPVGLSAGQACLPHHYPIGTRLRLEGRVSPLGVWYENVAIADRDDAGLRILRRRD